MDDKFKLDRKLMMDIKFLLEISPGFTLWPTKKDRDEGRKVKYYDDEVYEHGLEKVLRKVCADKSIPDEYELDFDDEPETILFLGVIRIFFMESD